MTEVPGILDALAEEHQRLGSPLRRFLRHGAAADDVRATLATLGLAPVPAVVDLFGWADGVDQARWLRASPGAARLTLFWPAQLLDLATSRAILLQTRAEAPVLERAPDAPTTGYWVRTWLPVLHGSPELYVVDCGPSSAAAVWRVSDIPSDDFPTRQVAASLGEYLASVLALFKANAYRWDPAQRAIVPVDEVFAELGLPDRRPAFRAR
jgi:cell wall assembly regulator SMI1